MRHSVDLVCHPATPRGEVEAIRAVVERASPGALDVRFRLEGATSELRIPARRPARIASRLWVHTCFEAFVAIDGARAYHEFNLSPSSEWAAHSFRDYRDGGQLDDETLAPRIVCSIGDDRLELDAELVVDRLSQAHAGSALRVGLSAVVEAADGALSYWALRHPLERPDFHHRDTFALVVEAVG